MNARSDHADPDARRAARVAARRGFLLGAGATALVGAAGLGFYAATPEWRRRARLWALDGALRVMRAGGRIVSLAVSPVAPHALSLDAQGEARLWDWAAGRALAAAPRAASGAGDVAFSPDGAFALIVAGGRPRLFTADLSEEAPRFDAYAHFALSAAFTPDGRRVVIGANDGPVTVWDLEADAVAAEAERNVGDVLDVAVSPDGRLAATASRAAPSLIDLETGQIVHQFDGHDSNVVSVAFTADGERLASASFDGTVKLWRPDQGELAQTLFAHCGSEVLRAVAAVPGGGVLAGGGDGAVRRWEGRYGFLVDAWEGHPVGVTAVAVTDDGMHVLSGDVRGAIRVWKIRRDG